MSFFNKVLASVGIGSAKVDTKLEKDSAAPGEVIRGVVEITGGNTEQKIDDIYLSLNTTYLKESDDKKYTVSGLIDRFRLSQSFTLAANERKEIPFTFNLPVDTPLSFGKTKIWVATGLDIKNAVDPSDNDYIRVVANPLMDSVLNAVSSMGFRLREAECEQAPHRLRSRLPFIQEFEFVPVAGPFRGKLDEMEVVFFPQSNGETEIMMQVDRKARGLGGFLAEALEMDETFVRFTVTNADIPYMQQKIQSVIAKYA
ncbi:sporulation protein SpoOM [Sporosarcina globispora]|uniref:Sporulation protein SpoOM n=1 Tax=Sporosarcina globispora TaxID=1459 RepID=A0A0M0GDN0_SPOGL|nr:sporulation protein [Sporosarcina globispora]KON87546.1 sporulation protein SpoOM [Sporosarcina globispora]